MAIAQSRAIELHEIPVVDIAPLGASLEQDRAIGNAVREACERVGFLYLTGHGFPEAMVEDIFTQCRRFFALPSEAHRAIMLTKSPLFRGFLEAGARGVNERPTDILESFNVARELGPDAPEVAAGVPLHGPNQWPAGLPGFRESVMAYYEAIDPVVQKLLTAFTLALGLPPGFFDGKFDRGLTSLRLLHYPPQPVDIHDKMGARAHRDTDFFTILLQDSVGGLEVQEASGEWLAAPPRPDMFVVNVGEMLQLLSGFSFQSAMHRVVNRSGKQRFSVPVFVTPNYDTVIEPMAERLAPGAPLPPPVHAGQRMLSFYQGLWPSMAQA